MIVNGFEKVIHFFFMLFLFLLAAGGIVIICASVSQLVREARADKKDYEELRKQNIKERAEIIRRNIENMNDKQ